MSSTNNSKALSSIRLFRTTPHPCSYKSGLAASTVFVDPDLVIDKNLNSKLSELGYRRSGGHLYRPDCETCSACQSCRIPVMQFAARRRHRKTWNYNQDLKVEICTDLAGDAEFALYQRYIDSRHDDGDMYPASAEQFEAFIKTKTVDTRFLKFYLEDQLLAVSVTDVLEQGLSAVYTFFEPSQAKRSLGSYAILWQVELAKKMQLEYLFLGYWVKGCQKMEYKSSYRPLQLLVDGQWVLAK